MHRTLLIAGLTLLLVGCVSQPKEVNASLSLVSKQEPIGDVIPEKYDSILNDKRQQSIVVEGLTIQTKAFYFSALGNQCRTLQVIKETATQTRTACLYLDIENENARTWYLIPSIIKPALNVIL